VTGCHGLGHRHRLSGQHAFVALELVDLQQTEVGWHDATDAKRYHVAWHEVGHRNPDRPSVPEDLGLVSDLAAERGHRHLGRYSLKKPRPTLRATMTAMITAFRPATGQSRHQCRPEKKDQDRVPDLAEEDGGSTHTVRTERVGPEPS